MELARGPVDELNVEWMAWWWWWKIHGVLISHPYSTQLAISFLSWTRPRSALKTPHSLFSSQLFTCSWTNASPLGSLSSTGLNIPFQANVCIHWNRSFLPLCFSHASLFLSQMFTFFPSIQADQLSFKNQLKLSLHSGVSTKELAFI